MNRKYKNQKLVDYVDTISKQILEAKHSNHHRDKFFPLLIDAMQLNIGAEIGVDKGGFSQHLLAKSKLSMLYCIDPWIDNFGSDHDPEYFDPNGQNRQADATKALAEFIPTRCTLMKGFSAEVVNRFEDNSLDFCYIDGDHSLEGIYTDIYSWIHKVKRGGILAGHDYKDGPKSGMPDYWGGQLPYKIKTVVDNFSDQYGFKLNVVGGRILSWYFVKNV